MRMQWRKSSYSGGANDSACVEVAQLPDAFGIRDSKDPHGEQLTVSGAVLGDFLAKIKRGVLDR
jgi:hypothetical protein